MSNAQDWFTPRRFILIVLGNNPGEAAESRTLLRAGEVFGITANRMRVALSRLVSEGLLDNPRRGHYRISKQGALVQREIDSWRELEQRRVAWQGDWCALLTENLASAGSTLWRHQLRVLNLRGLQRWRPGLWVRPNNLVGGLEQLVEDLRQLGLDAIQSSFVVSQGDAACETELQSLWDCKAINKQYQKQERLIARAKAQLPKKNFNKALVETLFIGSETVRMLNMDPLLPDQMIDGELRRAVISSMSEFDTIGKDMWREFYDSLSGD